MAVADEKLSSAIVYDISQFIHVHVQASNHNVKRQVCLVCTRVHCVCFLCARVGPGSTKFVSFEDRHWHSDCFVCSQCRVSLVGKGFLLEEDNILCAGCGEAAWTNAACSPTNVYMLLVSGTRGRANFFWPVRNHSWQNFSPWSTKFGLEIPILGNLGAKLKFCAPAVSFVEICSCMSENCNFLAPPPTSFNPRRRCLLQV